MPALRCVGGMVAFQFLHFLLAVTFRRSTARRVSLACCYHHSHLELEVNLFNGSVPSDISAMSRLAVLQLNNNFLFGSLPNSLTAMTALTYDYKFRVCTYQVAPPLCHDSD